MGGRKLTPFRAWVVHSSVKTTDQGGNEGDVLGVFVNDLGVVEIEIA